MIPASDTRASERRPSCGASKTPANPMPVVNVVIRPLHRSHEWSVAVHPLSDGGAYEGHGPAHPDNHGNGNQIERSTQPMNCIIDKPKHRNADRSRYNQSRTGLLKRRKAVTSKTPNAKKRRAGPSVKRIHYVGENIEAGCRGRSVFVVKASVVAFSISAFAPGSSPPKTVGPILTVPIDPPPTREHRLHSQAPLWRVCPPTSPVFPVVAFKAPRLRSIMFGSS